ncbi:MAG: hypothetical protein A2W00_11525 [Candidatus Eisenbacteria bacterium RBG_16_71_46]|nr:MAG: hypothetical protein A2W00_11525 [Candidatus Eisenbacteria bacterium RBG_16_71_46]OGF20257.1 MAG: hypothetical protein A2V63_01570 [Candidatus Eisenbacteria bacterium RBG_19FT_COMBO_70_11]
MTAGGAARRTVVKVCGLSRLEDARAALEAGADWLGFVVAGESPRRIDAARAGEILAALPGAHGVAVMVAPRPDEALDLARRAGAARVQLHRVEAASWPDDFPLPVVFALPVGHEGPAAALPHERHLLLLDAAHPTLAGGTGESFDWSLAADLARTRRLLLAGGLDGDNVALALERVRPFGVDASSRLEREPGVKDHDRVRRFVAAVRAFDARIDQHA